MRNTKSSQINYFNSKLHDLCVTFIHISLVKPRDIHTHLIPNQQTSAILPHAQQKRAEIFISNPIKYNTVILGF